MTKKYGTKKLDDMSNPKNWEIWEAPEHMELLYQRFPEFTCLCPRSGYPDFATVHIISIPGEKVVELKCLKLWLNSFREIGISHENATQKIARTLYDTLRLQYVFVLMEYTPRGNLTTFPMTQRIRNKWENLPTMEIETIKKKLLERII